MFKILKYLKYKDIFTRFIIYYIVVFLIPLTLGIYTYMNSYKISMENLNGYSKMLLNQLPTKMYDEIIKPLDLIEQTINVNPFYLTLLSKNNLLRNKNEIILEIRNFCQELTSYYTNPFILEIGIYLPSENIIITPSFFESVKLYYSYVSRPCNMSYTDWLRFLKGSYYKFYSPSHKFYLRGNLRNVTLFIHSLANWNFQNERANLFILLDEGKLEEFLRDISLNYKSNIYITKSNGDILFSYISVKGLDQLISNLNFKSININELKEVKYKKTKWIIFYTIDQNSWIYVVVIPPRTFLKPIYNLQHYLIFYFLISGILGIPIIIFLSLKSYQPINEIKNILFSKTNREKMDETMYTSSLNQFKNKSESFILKELAHLLVSEEKRLKEQLTEFLPIIQNSFIEQLLKGDIDPLIFEKKIYGGLSIKFVSDYFMVILIEVCDSQEFSKSVISDPSLVRFVVFNVMNETLATTKNKTFNVILSNNRLAILLNLDENMNNISNIVERIEYEKNFLKNNFLVFMTIGVSSIKKGLSLIAECYKEAEEALNFRFVSGNFSVYRYDVISTYYKLKDFIYITPDVENKLFGFILEGKKSELERILDSIYTTNFTRTSINPVEAKILCIHLYIIWESACNLINFKSSIDLLIEVERKILTGIGGDTSQNFFKRMKELFLQLADYVEKHKFSFTGTLIEKVIQYLNETFTDPNLSLVSIAEKFNITPQYLSKLFKEKTGQNLSDYILNLRIEKAKYLLLNTSNSINEIAQKVGYNYPNTFINVFKKIVGVTPSKFRTLVKND